MTDAVKPRLFRGLRDQLPEPMAARQWLIDTIRGVYELYGFVPLATPAIEYLDVLSGSAGTEAQDSIFMVKNPDVRLGDPDEPLGLRFDLTVPLARVVAQYRDLPRPFRRYQVSSVWRKDKPGPGRFREFTQFDLDSVGVASEVADFSPFLPTAAAAMVATPAPVNIPTRNFRRLGPFACVFLSIVLILHPLEVLTVSAFQVPPAPIPQPFWFTLKKRRRSLSTDANQRRTGA